ncbi:MAG: hypothetical protein H6711_03925 [Myxococcales bacterium]|nr:hypothetical protein [Myxococcales bacterium]
MRRSLLLLASLAACELGGPPPTAPAAAPSKHGAEAQAQAQATPRIPTCPAAASAPIEVDLDPRLDLGTIAGVRWLFGYSAGAAVLAHLGPTGDLALTPVPLHNAQIGASSGARIWLYAPRESATTPTRWTAIDVGDPEAPTLGPIEPLTLGAELDYAAALAVGQGRALVVAGTLERHQIVAVDTARRRAVGPPIDMGAGFLPVYASCEVDRCAVVAVLDEGGGPARRLAVVRVDARGRHTQELLAPEWVSQPHAAAGGDRWFVQWQDHEGTKLRALDRAGQPLAPARAVPWPKDRWIRGDALLAGDDEVVLALGDRERWSVASVGPDAALGPFRALPEATRYFLVGAPLADGLAWINIDGDVSYDEIGEGSGVMVHSWRAAAIAGFLPATGDPPPTIPVASGGGPGRGGFDVFLLTRPGAAAALAVPRGDASDFARPTLTQLRVPCSTG